jgi:hypothetical protein
MTAQIAARVAGEALRTGQRLCCRPLKSWTRRSGLSLTSHYRDDFRYRRAVFQTLNVVTPRNSPCYEFRKNAGALYGKPSGDFRAAAQCTRSVASQSPATFVPCRTRSRMTFRGQRAAIPGSLRTPAFLNLLNNFCLHMVAESRNRDIGTFARFSPSSSSDVSFARLHLTPQAPCPTGT